MRVIDSRVVNIGELKLEHFSKGDKFECNAARIGPLLGAKDLGYSYDVVPPGKRSCPFHSHRGEEEMFFIVKGEGTLRYGDETRKIRAGDVICCPPAARTRRTRSSTTQTPSSPTCPSAPCCRQRFANTPIRRKSALSRAACAT